MDLSSFNKFKIDELKIYEFNNSSLNDEDERHVALKIQYDALNGKIFSNKTTINNH